MLNPSRVTLLVLHVVLAQCLRTPSFNIGDKVLKLSPTSHQQRDLVSDLVKTYGLDVWLESHRNHDVTIRLTEADLDKLLPVLRSNDVIYNIVIPDISRLADDQQLVRSRRKLLSSEPLFRFDRYNTAQEINAILKYIASNCISCSLIHIGDSYQQLPLYVLQVGSGNKDALLLNGGMHAREWISPATVLYLTYQFAMNPGKDKDIQKLVARFDWFFIVLANPDGYNFSLQYPWNRFWRKTRSDNADAACRGTDPNRNFDFHWAESDTGDNPCDENYFGTSPFSEPETRALRDFVTNHLSHIKSYISFHSYGQHWVYPWLYGNCSSEPDDVEDLKRLAIVAVNRIRDFSGTQYSYGQAGCRIYPAAGASDDWMKGVAGIKYSYTVELPDHENGAYGFMLPDSFILPVANETLEGVKAFAMELSKVISY